MRNLTALERITGSLGATRLRELHNILFLNSSSGVIESKGGNFVDTYLSIFKSWYVSKFEYSESDEIDTMLLEEYLWLWGRVAIVFYGGKYILGKFHTVDKDLNGFPEKINFMPIGASNFINRNKVRVNFKVGENAVIINASTGYWINKRLFYTPFRRTRELLLDLYEVYNQILNNTKLSRSIIPVPRETSDENFNDMKRVLLSGSPVVKVDFSTADITRITNAKSLLEFKPLIPELIEVFQLIWEKIQTNLGIATNSNPDKKERQITSEIQINNALSDGINQTEILQRQKGLKQLQQVFGLSITVALRKKEQEIENDEEDTNE